MRLRRADHFAYFASDLLQLDGHDLRACPIQDRKAPLRDIVGAGCGPRLVTVDPFTGSGAALFEAVRQLGAEGIVSKRAGSPHRESARSDWLKAKGDRGVWQDRTRASVKAAHQTPKMVLV